MSQSEFQPGDVLDGSDIIPQIVHDAPGSFLVRDAQDGTLLGAGHFEDGDVVLDLTIVK